MSDENKKDLEKDLAKKEEPKKEEPKKEKPLTKKQRTLKKLNELTSLIQKSKLAGVKKAIMLSKVKEIIGEVK